MIMSTYLTARFIAEPEKVDEPEPENVWVWLEPLPTDDVRPTVASVDTPPRW